MMKDPPHKGDNASSIFVCSEYDNINTCRANSGTTTRRNKFTITAKI